MLDYGVGWRVRRTLPVGSRSWIGVPLGAAVSLRRGWPEGLGDCFGVPKRDRGGAWCAIVYATVHPILRARRLSSP